MQLLKSLLAAAFVLAPACLRAQTTWHDDFSLPHNYLTDGVRGTIWDGVYLGAGQFAAATDVGMAAGSVSVADADITSHGMLSVASLQTDWENASDDGFFLFKVVTGDFDMSAQIVGPINDRAHNFPGLMVRLFGAAGEPAPSGRENYLILGRFDEYEIPNMLKNNVNGVKRDTRLGVFPNSNYWLRVQRSGDVFTLSEKAAATDSWNELASVTRTNFGGAPVQAGLEHADYDGGHTLGASYKNFSLTVSNSGPVQPVPSPATDLKVTVPEPGIHFLTWTPGKDSAGGLVVIWRGSAVLQEAPACGASYSAVPAYRQGATLPATDYYVVYSGSAPRVAVRGLEPGVSHIAVFSYAGSGNSLTYTHTPAQTDVTVPPLPTRTP